MPVTIQQLAEHRISREAIVGADYEQANVAMLGGCECCGAALAAYNAYPARTGWWRCAGCIGDLGWDSVQEADADIFENP